MKTRWIGVAATALMVAAGPAWAATDVSAASGARRGTPEQKRAAALSASATAALVNRDAVKAVRDAEAATLLMPQDAGSRTLLGRAYLAAGRFVSAETAFSDALTLDPAISRAAVNRALAQIALGRTDAARTSLAMAEGLAPDADIGLAQALLGDVEGARQRLDAAARGAGADARTRQNLALAYALEGRWADSVAVAQQDVSAAELPQRLRRWAAIAQMKADPAMQIGAILGVLPAADSGQPAALALAAPTSESVAPVELAVAPPAPKAPLGLAEASPKPTSHGAAGPIAPVIHADKGSVVTQTNIAPPALDSLVKAPSISVTTVAPVPQPVIASAPKPVVPAAAPKAVAWAGPPRMRSEKSISAPARWAEAVTAEKKMAKAAAIKPAPSKPILLASHVSLKPAAMKGSGGSWAVQLGAFSTAERTEIAWGKLKGKAAFMSAYTPTGSGRRLGKAMLYRLSVSGLPNRPEAVSLCLRIRASGGDCFVRGARGERPMQWASRPRVDQPV